MRYRYLLLLLKYCTEGVSTQLLTLACIAEVMYSISMSSRNSHMVGTYVKGPCRKVEQIFVGISLLALLLSKEIHTCIKYSYGVVSMSFLQMQVCKV